MVTLHPFWVERDRQQAEQTELLNQAKDIFMVAVRPAQEALDTHPTEETTRVFPRETKIAMKQFAMTRDSIFGHNRISGKGLRGIQ